MFIHYVVGVAYQQSSEAVLAILSSGGLVCHPTAL